MNRSGLPSDIDADVVPAPPRGTPLLVRRVARCTPSDTWAALTDPWSLVLLLAGSKVERLDDAPWRLTTGDEFTVEVSRWGKRLAATIHVDAAEPDQALRWTVTYRHRRRVVLAGEHWSASIEAHAVGSWIDLDVIGTVLPGSPLLGRRRRLRTMREHMAIALREFDVLLTRRDVPNAYR